MKQRSLQPPLPRLVVFLGNPGKRYARSRHNFAWMVMESLFTIQGGLSQEGWKEKFHGLFLRRDNQVFLQPQTFMNHSGKSVVAALQFFGWSLEELLVVHDDLETPFGTVQSSFGGGHRGNNGLRSIITLSGGSDFWRLRLGIGRPPRGRAPGDWVLERFSPHEEACLGEITEGSAAFLLEQCRKATEKTLVFT
ncbi:hypothetical protein AU468_01365 [Alkalispirochaeta sphaeroplastigenens]|uniref:Peptidyl-tRNA hydrolase n=1 Tax=Alkalispirochaeta sphaeroplastigenens TaxID=1187066 RepID=A0A2S4K0S7_9SPIO|nr:MULTISPECIES: aminoacyl-tRNA hydrolase [Alkalispirochaeta]POR05356.1 hypothetical protein AU468_01365 [Alkalispirochaeta sphaeroplastigenens]